MDQHKQQVSQYLYEEKKCLSKMFYKYLKWKGRELQYQEKCVHTHVEFQSWIYFTCIAVQVAIKSNLHRDHNWCVDQEQTTDGQGTFHIEKIGILNLLLPTKERN